MIIIWWLRRDIRLNDNHALLRAIATSDGAVVPCYIFDDRLLSSPTTGAARLHFLCESLRELDGALRARGSMLVVRRGDPLKQLTLLLREAEASSVYWNRDYSPYAQARDQRVAEGLRAQGFVAESFSDVSIFAPDQILGNDGRSYSVYTPYWRRWWALAEAGGWEAVPLGPAPAFTTPTGLHSDPVPTAEALGFVCRQQVQPAGETAAHALLAQFSDLSRDETIGDYATARDRPALPATSRLSPHLRLGTIAPRACLQVALERLETCRVLQMNTADHDERTALAQRRVSIQTWISELAWRDFYIQILAHHPHVLRGAFRCEYDNIAWENNPDLLRAWQEGRTGYPIVDAGMRQLNQEAWMHNRLRMITASFLTKDLLINWQLGERYFMQQLACGDPAANNGGWQWVAGTGTDAQPYFRIFNPTSQSQKFDPNGTFIKRYLPELSNLPAHLIHEPWKLTPADQVRYGLQIGRDYPEPIVDHKKQRERALVLYRGAKE